MMPHKSPALRNFEILCDSRSEDNQLPQDRHTGVLRRSQPLHCLSISQSQNRQPEQVRVGIGAYGLSQASHNLCRAVIRESSKKDKPVGSRLTRPSITSNTFDVLDTVVESEPRTQREPIVSEVSNDAQQSLKLAADPSSTHPLSIAARNIPPLEQQLAKHRDCLFEWILAVGIPGGSESEGETGPGTDSLKGCRKAYFGCNLLPEPSSRDNRSPSTAHQSGNYLLLATSLIETKQVLEVFRDPIVDSDMALPEAHSTHSTPIKTLGHSSPEENASTPHSTIYTNGDDSLAESAASRSPGNVVTRIEDSFEALDILEDQLEAFDKVARFGQFIPPKEAPHAKKSTAKAELVPPSLSVRFATPQPRPTFTKPSPASLRLMPVSEPRKTVLRKATSMNLDPHKFKTAAKTVIQPSLEKSKSRGATSPSLRTVVAGSPKQRTIPTFELPGEVAARQLNEKKEVRPASQRATQPTAASLRRARSAKLPTRPEFELPGEAISRRKREEHQAQLRIQEEEEKKRREFKARPLPSHIMPSTVPRDTVTSRARQNKATLAENASQGLVPKRRPFTTVGPHSRPALSTTINQSQPRGRGLRVEDASIPHVSRATSTSTASASGKRSPLSVEDVQMQKLRGHEIYRRDNSWTDGRMREKYEREALAKLAREEAAERSRQKSREWAAKQAKKRMTIGSLRDVMT